MTACRAAPCAGRQQACHQPPSVAHPRAHTHAPAAPAAARAPAPLSRRAPPPPATPRPAAASQTEAGRARASTRWAAPAPTRQGEQAAECRDVGAACEHASSGVQWQACDWRCPAGRCTRPRNGNAHARAPPASPAPPRTTFAPARCAAGRSAPAEAASGVNSALAIVQSMPSNFNQRAALCTGSARRRRLRGRRSGGRLTATSRSGRPLASSRYSRVSPACTSSLRVEVQRMQGRICHAKGEASPTGRWPPTAAHGRGIPQRPSPSRPSPQLVYRLGRGLAVASGVDAAAAEPGGQLGGAAAADILLLPLAACRSCLQEMQVRVGRRAGESAWAAGSGKRRGSVSGGAGGGGWRRQRKAALEPGLDQSFPRRP